MKFSTKIAVNAVIIIFIITLTLLTQNSFCGNFPRTLNKKNIEVNSADNEDELRLTLFGTLYTEKNQNDIVSIKVYDLTNSTEYKIENPDDFTINLEFDKEYQIEFVQTGYLSKKIIIDTNIPDDISKDFPPFNISVTLIKANQESNTLEPLTAGKIFYSADIDNFTAMILNNSNTSK